MYQMPPASRPAQSRRSHATRSSRARKSFVGSALAVAFGAALYDLLAGLDISTWGVSDIIAWLDSKQASLEDEFADLGGDWVDESTGRTIPAAEVDASEEMGTVQSELSLIRNVRAWLASWIDE